MVPVKSQQFFENFAQERSWEIEEEPKKYNDTCTYDMFCYHKVGELRLAGGLRTKFLTKVVCSQPLLCWKMQVDNIADQV